MNGNQSLKLFKKVASFVGVASVTALLSFPASARLNTRYRSAEISRSPANNRLYSQAGYSNTPGTRSYEFRSPRLAQGTQSQQRVGGRSNRSGNYTSGRRRGVRALW